MDRVYFPKKEDSIEFFDNLRENSKLSWNKISKLIGTTRSMVGKYREGELSIPEERFNHLLSLINVHKEDYFLRKTRKKNKNWGQIIGGKKAYKINKKSFAEGRKQGGYRVKYEFNICMPLSEELCEFIGVIIGDGFTNKYGTMYETQIVGDKNLDKEYYFNKLSKICQSLFNIKPNIAIKEDGIRLTLYSKRVFELLTKRFKIPKGVKSYTVEIPLEIQNSESKFLKATVRGMFDTDGGVGFDKRKRYKKPYVRINYTSASKILIQQLSSFLKQENIPHSIHPNRNSQIIQINGEQNVKGFIHKIGFSNQRHIKKIAYLTN